MSTVTSVVSSTINIQIPPPPPPPPPTRPGRRRRPNPEGLTPVITATIVPFTQGKGITTKMAYDALKLVSETAVPTDCNAIYNHQYADIEDGGPVK